ncbi:hypothetical protein ACWT_7491 [Actinoplanes sp. SE50]|uniref:hypothetical protein n=1 Tax=unclassified Actinoplanes TaxID=2626549 RepID=UPI00023EDC9E|nr:MULTISPECIES: hypothetical protein [unclassified Actinoplanes]AEV88501.1 hypothetical protein ACPL_7621 [Actinoplanes sp. SE50/110]ATO86906.1 hypothetical protein ACWT_7491 [Actinoplanes sp. SE50]SLM04324.1 hypothetical protein ACSP50_7629 [Actinoplanes sp. SE50/110]
MSEPFPQQSAWSRPGGAWSSGTVTGIGVPPQSPPPPPASPEPSRRSGPERQRRQLLIFGGVAGLILSGGLIVLLVIVFSGDDPFGHRAHAPTDVRPPLAQACPAPTDPPGAAPAPAPSAPPAATGARTVDREAGISYRQYGAPWRVWNQVWRAGTLKVNYKVGQHFVTETYSAGDYHASILSAAVPAADNDAVTLDLQCVGRQVAADVRANYYPQPNTLEPLRDEVTTLGGRPAYVSEFRLHFHAAGLTATSELSAVAVIDVGKPSAAVLYVSIPGTHRQFDYVIDDVLSSVRPL